MNRVIKKASSLLLAFLLIAGCFSGTFAIASGEYTESGFTYRVSGGEAVIVSYPRTAEGEIVIPQTLCGYKVTEIEQNAFYGCTLCTKITVPNTVTEIGDYAFAFCVSLERIVIPSSVKTIGKDILILSNDAVLYCDKDSQAHNYAIDHEINYILIDDIYNMGEESYSFENFGDVDSPNGHCFGMSMTSSAYHIGELETSIIGLSDVDDLYSCSDSAIIRDPICYYQAHQEFALDATVAGGNYYKGDTYDISDDWHEVINYLSSHEYDDTGMLQIGFRKDGEGGHAINFLRYAVIDGQDRIYAYDNNFPDNEIYFYENSDGEILQEPNATFSGSIDCIALRDVSTYFDLAGRYEASRAIYSDRDEISVDGIDPYPIDGGIEMGERVMFAIPSHVSTVKIIPLVDNASFTYANKEYSFEEITEDTYGVLDLSNVDSEVEAKGFTVINGADSCSHICHKTGFMGFIYKIIRIFWKLFRIHQTCECGVKHY